MRAIPNRLAAAACLQLLGVAAAAAGAEGTRLPSIGLLHCVASAVHTHFGVAQNQRKSRGGGYAPSVRARCRARLHVRGFGASRQGPV